jgi:hypothetical protein
LFPPLDGLRGCEAGHTDEQAGNEVEDDRIQTWHDQEVLGVVSAVCDEFWETRVLCPAWVVALYSLKESLDFETGRPLNRRAARSVPESILAVLQDGYEPAIIRAESDGADITAIDIECR